MLSCVRLGVEGLGGGGGGWVPPFYSVPSTHFGFYLSDILSLIHFMSAIVGVLLEGGVCFTKHSWREEYYADWLSRQ